MKKTGCWVIFFGLLTIPAAIYYSIQLWNYFTKTAELSVLVRTQKVELPRVYNEFLQTLDSSSGRRQLHAIYDSAAKEKSNAGYPFNRDEVRQFADSTPLFGWREINVFTVKIVNIGRKAANNVKVFFPAGGLAEVTKDDNAVDAPEHTGWIELGTLEPSSQFVVMLWTGRGSPFEIEGIRVTSDEGAANVREWYVSRDKNHWVIGFGPTEVFFFGFIGLVIFALIVVPIIGAIASHSGTKTEIVPEETKPESPK